ncbi:MAG: hypothetical protein KDA68_16000 [Planctomycetaceae bacterium]|nr:hypothetical protein [Planctomycetaceae bacterium]
MSRQRPQYTAEFKAEVVRRLGIHSTRTLFFPLSFHLSPLCGAAAALVP